MLSVGVAISKGGVDGPYEDLGSELVTTSDMGMIDPTFYRDNNTNYLIWKEDANDPAHCSRNCYTRIFLSPLDESGTKVLLPRDKWVVLIQQSQSWEGPLVEAPWIIFNPATDYYYLFYSGNGYASRGYAVGVARAHTLAGPWTKYPANPILHTGTSVFYGPGHCSVVDVIAARESVRVGEGVGEGEAHSEGERVRNRMNGRHKLMTSRNQPAIYSAAEDHWAVVHHAWNPDNTGRNVLMYALEWTADGWPATSTPAVGPFPAPTP